MRPVTAQFAADVERRCLDALVSRGFRRSRKRDVDWPLDHDFSVWVGLNRSLRPDRVDIAPFIGVHSAGIEGLWMRMVGKTYPDRQHGPVATHAIPLGKLESAGGERAFAFGPGQSAEFIAAECNRLADLYVQVGVPFARSIASHDALLPLLQARVDMLNATPERVASCLSLSGRREEARAFTVAFLAREPEYFERFATPFLKAL